MDLLGFEVVGNYPALWMEEPDLVVIADLHLGLEKSLAERGMYLPRFQLEEIKEDLNEIIKWKDPEMMVINGDVKHDFGRSDYLEGEEIRGLLDFLSEAVEKVIILKRNHDNYLAYFTRDRKDVELKDRWIRDDVCFFHGHQKDLTIKEVNAETFILAHEHPALVLGDEAGAKEKIKCFAYGELEEGKNIIVMPAFSKLASGNRINGMPREELLSPFLRKFVELGELKPVEISEEAGPMEFPKLKEVR